ncbi:Alpha/Beta hydrolase protein [Dioszegia hungarica]|uniref:Carboxypeptidase n=1 Tax=Dioszegia hungarica TaxID=4972 RepID=A0AA38HBE2_9TREE|nr:Alpha/Beta hydrolase protein [Dioszegia hungarica]KAI9636529.1 Alpha/Beta hydrolase protein [Dioszegia hungarica]
MRTSTLVTLLPFLAGAIATPFQFPTDPTQLAAQAVHSVQDWFSGAVSQASTKFEQWEKESSVVKAENVVTNGIEYLSLTHPEFPLHRLRVVSPKICDSSVKQYSGYLDISETKHLFFWFEESRSKPKDDPLVLWLNGGPGCSSTTGLLFELGGCTIENEGQNVTRNKHSWNNVANVLFLDQPVGVGFSYSDSGEVNNSPAAAEDVYAFLILFISQFDKYAKQPFHIAGESYAGTYLPHIANVIHSHNSALQLAPTPKVPVLNFKSVMIGNGLTNAYEQFGAVADWACDGPYAVYAPDASECVALRGKQPRCQSLISSCQKTGSRFSCVPAALYCWSLFNSLQELGLNMYDVRRKCDKSKDKDGPLCYREMGWMETYLNKPEVKKELGAPADINFESCNMKINQNFLLQGDGVKDTASLLPALIEDGIRVLLYSGEADMLVNFIGCSRVLDTLVTSYQNAYLAAPTHNFTASDGKVSGWTKKAGDGAGNVAFVAFANAGHMVPHDDPVAALTMFERWLANKPLA